MIWPHGGNGIESRDTAERSYPPGLRRRGQKPAQDGRRMTTKQSSDLQPGGSQHELYTLLVVNGRDPGVNQSDYLISIKNCPDTEANLFDFQNAHFDL